MATTFVLGVILVGLLLKLATMLNARRMQRAIGHSSVRTFDTSENDTLAIVPWRNDGELLAPEEAGPPIIRIGDRGLPEADKIPARIETKTPRREPGLEADVAVPGLQAAITAVMVAIAVGLLSWAAGWNWRVTVVMFALSLVAAWFWRLRLMDSLLWSIETVTGQDFNGDHQIGRPQAVFTVANPHQARAAVAAETRQHQADSERAALLAFVDKCYISGCGEHAHGIKASSPARAEYVNMRDTLLTLGVAAWKSSNPKSGWKMTVSRHRARQIVEKHLLARS